MTEDRLNEIWYGGRRPAWWMGPASGLFRLLSAFRRRLYRWRVLPSIRISVPVVVVGNLTAGGSGKTPLILALAEILHGQGLRVGVVSRGYGSRAGKGPLMVQHDSSPEQVGDEPLLIHRKGHASVVVGRDRVAGARRLVEQGCQVVLSDDGLQHYRLQRDLEIVVVDGRRQFGNGRLMPAGPLRELPKRLKQVDFVVQNGAGPLDAHPMELQTQMPVSLSDESRSRPLHEFTGSPVHAVAGIGDPTRFFQQLEDAGLTLRSHPFPDHHVYRADDFEPFREETVLMTEKDAVKCREFAAQDWWRVPVRAELPETLTEAIVQRILALRKS